MKKRQESLVSSETAFHDAAIHAIAHTGDDVNDDPNALHDTDQMVRIARTFLIKTCPEFLEALDENNNNKSTTDRLVKVGRNVSSTMRFARRASSSASLSEEEVSVTTGASSSSAAPASITPLYSKAKIDASLALLADECTQMVAILRGDEQRRVPKVRFGKTELQMPILTLGCMRFQQSWNRGGTANVLSIQDVNATCQDNLIEILKYALQMGVVHIETAKGYGSSELQVGHALKVLLDSGFVKRQDLIIQTKSGVSSSMTPATYRQQILEQLERLQLDYVDLFSVHGINSEEEYEWLFNRGEAQDNLITAVHELKKERKIRHIGFSTHGNADLIGRVIETNHFEYVNLHYHFCGSYTASGDGEFGGNLANLRLAQERDMGVFIISAYDKGGRLYAPSHKLRELTLPDLEPMAYGSTWLWQHHLHSQGGVPIHTIVCGAARPSDLDQPILASLLLLNENEAKRTAQKRERVTVRLVNAFNDELGEDWSKTWHVGLPNWTNSKFGTQHGNIVWIYNLVKAYGMLDFGKERYSTLVNSSKVWDTSKTKKENIAAIGPVWGWVPGCAFDPTLDYTEDLMNCPVENQERLKEAIQFVHKWCSPEVASTTESSTSELKEEGEEEKKSDDKMNTVPLDWETAYDMRPWTAFPER